MTANTYKKRIIEACKALGTYKEQFDMPIERLAELLRLADEAMECYTDTGAGPVMEFNGGKTLGMNSYLKVYTDLTAQALKLWTELGLTPAGLKKIGEQGPEEKESELVSAIRSLSNGK